MSTLPAEERAIREILIAANVGEASEAQLERLDQLILSDARLANYSARMLEQQAALAWQGVRGDPSRTDSTGAAAKSATRRVDTGSDQAGGSRSTGHGVAWSILAAGLAFVLGVTLSNIIWRSDSWSEAPELAVGPPQVSRQSEYEARLVRSPACLRDPSSNRSRAIGSALSSDE